MKKKGAEKVTRYGFIRSKEDIKFLILFAMELLPFAASFDTIVDITTWCDDGFGYFELSEAFYELVPTGHIEASGDASNPFYSITKKGREAISAFAKNLPLPVREAAERSTIRVVRQIRRDATIHTKTIKHAEKDFTVRLEMDQVFAIEMNVVSAAQAAMLEKTFKLGAENIYQTLLSALTANYGEEKSELF